MRSTVTNAGSVPHSAARLRSADTFHRRSALGPGVMSDRTGKLPPLPGVFPVASARMPVLVATAPSGLRRAPQIARQLHDTMLERDERRVAVRVGCGCGKETTTGPDHAAGQHEVVVQREGFDRHAVAILILACRAHAKSAAAERGDTIEEGPVIINPPSSWPLASGTAARRPRTVGTGASLAFCLSRLGSRSRQRRCHRRCRRRA